MNTYTYFDDAYRGTLEDLLKFGRLVAPRKMVTKELVGYEFKLTAPAYNLLHSQARKLNQQFAIAEWLWVQGGHNSLAMIQPYNAVLNQFSDDGRVLSGAYGPKFIDQLSYVRQQLIKDPNTRQAIITFWRERPQDSRDIPCTISLQFLLRETRLELVVYMRSNDAWLGLPYDVFTFTQLQRYLAMELDAEAGTYHHMVGSMHLYEHNFSSAEEVVREVPEAHFFSPKLSVMPHGFKAVYEGITLMYQDRALSGESNLERRATIKAWIEPITEVLPETWRWYLHILASRFTKDYETGIPEDYQTLLKLSQ